MALVVVTLACVQHVVGLLECRMPSASIQGFVLVPIQQCSSVDSASDKVCLNGYHFDSL